MTNNKKYGVYNGIVIQNNDPNRAGQVKVWVPSISPTVYDNFNSLNKNKKIKLLGFNKKSGLTADIIAELRLILPWAPLAMSVSNEGSTGRYNFFADVTKTSNDSNLLNTDRNDIVFSEFDKNDKKTRNTIINGDKPGAIYEENDYRLSDAFDGSNKNVNNINASAKNYKPNTYSRSSRGEFGVPNVGAHVLVQFLEGDPHFPVVTHVLYGQVDWNSLYNESEYPGTYENKKIVKGEYNHNVDKYRSKYILNQKGGTLEINNTDNNEKIKLTHYSGSFKEYNNNTTIELAVNDDQKLVQGNRFATVRGSDNVFVYGDQDINVNGDHYRKVGNLNYNAMVAWKAEIAQIANLKQLFYIKRCNADNILLNASGDVIAKFNSTLQKKDGKHCKNPNIKNIKTVTSVEDDENYFNAATEAVNTLKNEDYKNDGVNPNPPTTLNKVGSVIKEYQTINSPELSESSMGGDFKSEELKENIADLYNKKLVKLIDVEKNMGLGGSDIIHITKDKSETIGMVMNDYGSIRIDSIGKMYNAEMQIGDTTTYTKAIPSPLVEYVNVPPLPGGTYTLTVCNAFNVMVGAGGVNIKSYGSANLAGTVVNVSGEQVNIGSNNDINIESGGRLSIAAEILTLRQKNHKQVLVESTLGVSNNIIIGGSAYIEGETFLQHVTAPCEYQVTESQKGLAGTLGNDILVGEARELSLGSWGTFPPIEHWHKIYITEPNCIRVYPHSHVFKNLPLTLTTGPAIVREHAKKLAENVSNETLEKASEQDRLLNPGDYGSAAPQQAKEIQHKYHEAINQ